MKPLFIFDLDGTLALTDHRQHLVQQEKPDWDAFFDACDQDDPNIPVIKTLAMLKNAGCDIWVWSGRSDAVKHKTKNWMVQNGFYHHIDSLKMRADGDHTPDDELKKTWLNDLIEHDEQRLVAIFDDRDKVVDMWRRNGVSCFQVAKGDF